MILYTWECFELRVGCPSTLNSTQKRADRVHWHSPTNGHSSANYQSCVAWRMPTVERPSTDSWPINHYMPAWSQSIRLPRLFVDSSFFTIRNQILTLGSMYGGTKTERLMLDWLSTWCHPESFCCPLKNTNDMLTAWHNQSNEIECSIPFKCNQIIGFDCIR